MAKKFDFNQLLGFVAFVGLLFIGVSLVCTKFISGADMALIRQILTYIVYGVLACVSFFFCASRNNPAYFGIWTVAVILIVLSIVL